MEKSRILLIEDNKSHLADAMTLLEERVRSGAINEVYYVSTLNDAIKNLTTRNYEGVISDVFFPTNNGEKESQNGINIGEWALIYSLPFVLITSTYHHGKKTQPVCSWARGKGTELVDMDIPGNRDGESQDKNWKGAYLALAYIMEGKKSGEILIDSDGFKARPSIYSFIAEVSHGVGHFRNDPSNLNRFINEHAEKDHLLKRTLESYCKGVFE